jgi:hypothetical protein
MRRSGNTFDQRRLDAGHTGLRVSSSSVLTTPGLISNASGKEPMGVPPNRLSTLLRCRVMAGVVTPPAR